MSASGCIIDDSYRSGGGLLPGPVRELAGRRQDQHADHLRDAGAATSVTGQVGGVHRHRTLPGRGVVGPAARTSRWIRLDTYDVNVQLLDANGAILSQTGVNMPPPSIYVDCSGNTQSPTLLLSIN